jgi:hypothetical protein
MSEALLYADGARGIYIPQYFATSIHRNAVTGVTSEDLDLLAGDPDQEWYWETWADVLDNAVVTDTVTGIVYHLYQDGDLWLIPDDMVWDDETEFFKDADGTNGQDRESYSDNQDRESYTSD